MEEQKADLLFRFFTQTDAAAKQKKGLGFAPGGAGFESSALKPSKQHGDVSEEENFIQSTFVKQGTAPKPVSAAQSAAVARREAEDSARARRSAADAVAAKLAAKAAELKRQRQQDRDMDTPALQLASKLIERYSGKQEASLPRGDVDDRDPPQRSSHADEDAHDEHRRRDRSRRSCRDEETGEQGDRNRDRHQERGRDQRASRDGDRGREGSRDRKSLKDRDRRRSRSKDGQRRDRDTDRRRSRSREGQRRDRDADKDRRRSRSRDGQRRDRDTGRHRSRSRDGTQSRHGSKPLHGVDSGNRSAPAVAAPDFSRLIPGWDRMSPADRLKARTKWSLQQADGRSHKRSHAEQEEAIKEAEEAGRMAAELAAARPWTRFVFDRCAPLEGEGARPSLAFLDERDSKQDEGVAGPASTDGGAPTAEGDPDGFVNAVSFRASSHVAARKQRDLGHDSAIFGTGAAAAKPLGEKPQGAAARDLPASEKFKEASEAVRRREQLRASQPAAVDDEDGPVVVTEEELQQISMARAFSAADRPLMGQAVAISMSESSEVREKQQTMSWRERAMLARNKK